MLTPWIVAEEAVSSATASTLDKPSLFLCFSNQTVISAPIPLLHDIFYTFKYHYRYTQKLIHPRLIIIHEEIQRERNLISVVVVPSACMFFQNNRHCRGAADPKPTLGLNIIRSGGVRFILFDRPFGKIVDGCGLMKIIIMRSTSSLFG